MIQLTYTPKMYVCDCCGVAKPGSDFYTESYTGARTNQCKECINIKRRVQRHKSKHGKFISKEKIRGMETPDFTLEDWKVAMLHFRGSCAFCGKPEGRAKAEKLDRDHLLAISRGGKTVRGNVIPACRYHNRARGNKLWREWFKQQDCWTIEREKRLVDWENKFLGGTNG